MRKNAKILRRIRARRDRRLNKLPVHRRDVVFRQLRIPLGNNPTGAYHHAPVRALQLLLLLLDRRPRSRIIFGAASGRGRKKRKRSRYGARGERDAVLLHAIARSVCKEKRGRLVGRSVGRAICGECRPHRRARAPYRD